MAERNFKNPQPESARVLSQDANHILTDNEDADQVYVDGIGQYHIGAAITKMRFFNVISSETKNGVPFEKRAISRVVVIPTAQLFEALLGITVMLRSNLTNVEKQSTASLDSIKKLIDAFREGT
jgi:hypothetical protein